MPHYGHPTQPTKSLLDMTRIELVVSVQSSQCREDLCVNVGGSMQGTAFHSLGHRRSGSTPS